MARGRYAGRRRRGRPPRQLAIVKHAARRYLSRSSRVYARNQAKSADRQEPRTNMVRRTSSIDLAYSAYAQRSAIFSLHAVALPSLLLTGSNIACSELIYEF